MSDGKRNPPPEKSKGLQRQTQDFSSSPARGEVNPARGEGKRWCFVKARHKNIHEDYILARSLRHEASPIEWKLWVSLRENAKAKGIKFRRQHAVHPYVADFACMAVKVLIEIDGDSHAGKGAYDKQRELFLNKQGYDILRFSNDEVVHNVVGVVFQIISYVEERMKTLSLMKGRINA